ncbi:MAG: tetratricopeptide repeat protein [Fusobacteriaceae bacterium]
MKKNIAILVLSIALAFFIGRSQTLENKVEALRKVHPTISVENIKDNEALKKFISEQNNYEDAKLFYEKTITRVEKELDFIQWFATTILGFSLFFVGFQFFKNEKDYKDNQEKFEDKLKGFDFNLKLSLAINKNIPSEKVDALEELTKNSEYKNKLGLIYFYLGYYTSNGNDKIKYLTEAIKQFEKNKQTECEEYFESLFIRGCSYWDTQEKDKAKKDYEKVIRSNENNEDSTTVLNCKGILNVFEKKYDDAIEKFNDAIKKSPRSWWSFLNLPPALSGLEKYKEAIEYSDKAINLNPNYFVGYSNRAYAKYRLGIQAEVNHHYLSAALNDCDKSIELNPDYSNVYNTRGLVYEKLQNYKYSLVDYNKALEINPDFEKAIENKKRLLKEHPELLKK